MAARKRKAAAPPAAVDPDEGPALEPDVAAAAPRRKHPAPNVGERRIRPAAIRSES